MQDLYSIELLVLLMNCPNPTTTASIICRTCQWNGKSGVTFTCFEVSSCRIRLCFCCFDGIVVCPMNTYRVTYKDDCMACLNPFPFNRLPPYATFRSGIFACECSCFETYSCSTAWGIGILSYKSMLCILYTFNIMLKIVMVARCFFQGEDN